MEVADDQGKAGNQVLREICLMVQNSTKNAINQEIGTKVFLGFG